MARDKHPVLKRLPIAVTLALPIAASGAGMFVAPEAGYRTDALDWNIAAADGSPDVLSELEWDDLEIWQFGVSGGIEHGRWRLNARAAYGWIVDGESRDSDYLGDDRTGEFSRSVSRTDGDDVTDVALSIGYRLPVAGATPDALQLVPLAGYTYRERALRLRDGRQVIATAGVTPAVGPIDGLDSTFKTEWEGPWLGAALELQASDRLRITLRGERHWLDYRARANWNLREALAHPDSMAQTADGRGTVWALRGNYRLEEDWEVALGYEVSEFITEAGDHTFFYADGVRTTVPLNEVNGSSRALTLGLTRRF